MERKSLRDISWQVSEPEYRQDPALSYSTLARYEREGFNNLSTLFDRIESPSLTFGSLVDTLITGTDEEFNDQFMVADSISISDSLVSITLRLFKQFKDEYNDIQDIPSNELLDAIKDIQWNNHWLPKTRVTKIKSDCAGYYKLLYIADGRTIISSELNNVAESVVNSLKSSDSTKFYFEDDNPFDDNVQRFYQLKFKAKFNGIPYRIMADELIVVHDKKTVIPIDLKTSSKPEWDFYKSFIDWRYDIQSRLYWKVIRDNMDRDPYYKDFKLADYKFIVVSRNTLTPLIWDFAHTQAEVPLVLDNGFTLRHPFQIAKELNVYLQNKPTVPNGIDTKGINKIEDWITIQ